MEEGNELVDICSYSLWSLQISYICKKKDMKNRLFSNYVTTILGCLILIFCGVMIYTEKETTEGMAGWLAVGLMFLRSKDSLIALPAKEK